MQSLSGSPCRSPVAPRQRGQGLVSPLGLRSRPQLTTHAKRREVDRNVSFADLYEGIADRVSEGKGLPVSDTYVLVENVRNADQANRFLDLLQKCLQMKAARIDASLSSVSSVSSLSSIDDASLASTSDSNASGLDFGRWLSDWHYRKRYLTRLCEIAVLELNKPDVLFRVVGNMDAFKISTYFGKELILQLGRAGVDTEVLVRVASLVLQQRGVQDKGTREAHLALLEVMRKRGAGPEAMAPVKTVLNSAKRLPAVTTPPAVTPTPAATLAAA